MKLARGIWTKYLFEPVAKVIRNQLLVDKLIDNAYLGVYSEGYDPNLIFKPDYDFVYPVEPGDPHYWPAEQWCSDEGWGKVDPYMYIERSAELVIENWYEYLAKNGLEDSDIDKKSLDHFANISAQVRMLDISEEWLTEDRWASCRRLTHSDGSAAVLVSYGESQGQAGIFSNSIIGIFPSRTSARKAVGAFISADTRGPLASLEDRITFIKAVVQGGPENTIEFLDRYSSIYPLDMSCETQKIAAELFVNWNGIDHALILTPRNWRSIVKGNPLQIRGKGIRHDGKFYWDYWSFHGGVQGEAKVSYGKDLEKGFTGLVSDLARREFAYPESPIAYRDAVWIVDDAFVMEPFLGGRLLGELPVFSPEDKRVVHLSQEEFDNLMEDFYKQHGYYPDT